MQVWELIIASGIIGMVFAFGQQLVMWKLGRKAAKEDQAELNIEERIKACLLYTSPNVGSVHFLALYYLSMNVVGPLSLL